MLLLQSTEPPMDDDSQQPAQPPASRWALSSAARLELEAAERKHPYVSLWGALHGERWGLPGVGDANGFLVPVHVFPAERIVGRYFLKLIRTEEGWEPLRDDNKQLVLSPAPVSEFVDKHKKPYAYGSLAIIADDEGRVDMFFHHTPQPALYEEIPCATSTPSSHSCSSRSINSERGSSCSRQRSSSW